MSKVAHNFKEKSRTGDVLITESVDFGSLLLSEPVLRGLKNSGFDKPSPIQLKAIPLGRCGLDLIVQAKSGTGKTCVFSVVALESIVTDTASTQVLVLAPTREIAVQIWEVVRSIGSAMKELVCHTFIGGLPVQEDRVKLKKCHIAVGSPGRIQQLIECGALRTDSVRLFVLDEADKLLEESFQEQINWIYSTLPENKQMLALSATYPEYLADHLTAYMRNPTFLRLNISDPALLGIRQYYHTVPYHPLSHVVFEEKSKVLINILSSVSFEQCLVFSNLQTRAQTLADSLIKHGWPTACIAGCLDQKDRNHAMARLKTYKCRILISTDLTSRGIDADKVNMVINLDVPQDHETYLHRIGRAGRFGSFGIAVTLISDGQERLDLDSVEKKCNTQILNLPDPLPSDLAKPDCPIFLDDVVSSEVIDTVKRKSPQRSPLKPKMDSPIKSQNKIIDNEKDINVPIGKNSAEIMKENTDRTGECLSNNPLKQKLENQTKPTKKSTNNAKDKENINGIMGKRSAQIVNGFGESVVVDNTGEKIKSKVSGMNAAERIETDGKVDSHVWENGNEDFIDELEETRDVVSYEEVEYSKITELEFEMEGTNQIYDENNIVFTKGTDSRKESMKKRLFSPELKFKNLKTEETVETAKEESQNDKVSSREESLLNSNVIKVDSERSTKTENSKGHLVQHCDLQVHRNHKLPSLPASNVNVTRLFKNNTGFKRLNTSHSYATAKESLKLFREKVEEDKELVDETFDGSVPKADNSNIEADTFREAVIQLQELLENRLSFSKKEITNEHVDDKNDNEVEDTELSVEDETNGNNSISSEDEFEAKEESLNRKTDSPVPSIGSDVSEKPVRENDEQTDSKIDSFVTGDLNIAEDALERKRSMNSMSKPRRQRFGYQGSFAIGHLLQQQRAQNLKLENSSGDTDDLKCAGDAPEHVLSTGSKPSDLYELNRFEKLELKEDKLDENETISTRNTTLTSFREEHEHPSIADFRKDIEKIPCSQTIDNKEKGGDRIDFDDEPDSASDETSGSSETDSESTEEETIDTGARPKMNRVTGETYRAGSDVRQHKVTKGYKQDSGKSKNGSMSKADVNNDKQSHQMNLRQWYEQYENWYQQSMKMWGYSGMYQNYPQNTNTGNTANYGYTGHYQAPSMYYPYQQHFYPYSYPHYLSPYSQQQSSPAVPEQMGNAFEFQEEYLKKMSKFWKKEKKKSKH